VFFFFGNCAVYEIMRKIMVEPAKLKWRHNMAHTLCMLDRQSYARAHACTRLRASETIRTHVRMRARAHTHTHTNTSCLLLFHGNSDSLRCLNVTLHVHCLPFLIFYCACGWHICQTFISGILACVFKFISSFFYSQHTIISGCSLNRQIQGGSNMTGTICA
jgi:hypothetical protein